MCGNDTLKEFVRKVNELLKEATSEKFPDSKAYSLAVRIELELDEAAFVKKIVTTDPIFIRLLKRIENDAKRHRLMFVNYSRGIK